MKTIEKWFIGILPTDISQKTTRIKYWLNIINIRSYGNCTRNYFRYSIHSSNYRKYAYSDYITDTSNNQKKVIC